MSAVVVIGEVLVELSSPETLRNSASLRLGFSGDALNAAADNDMAMRAHPKSPNFGRAEPAASCAASLGSHCSSDAI